MWKDIKVDALVQLASTLTPEQGCPLVKTFFIWTIEKLDKTMVKEEPSWMDKIIFYKKDKMLPTNPIVA